LHDGFDLAVVQLNRFSQAVELLDKFAGRSHKPAKPDEGSHNLNVHPNRRRRTQHTGEHGDTMFGEHPRQFSAATIAQT
jgi:hypothetical protein